MRYTAAAILVLFLVFNFSCRRKDGLHRIVDVTDQHIAADEVYINFLSNQIEKRPKTKGNYIKLAKLYKATGEMPSAISVLEMAAEQIPDDLDILIELATLYFENENADSLEGVLRTMQAIDPEHREFLKLSAGHALLLEDYTNSIFFSNRAMLANPYDDENYYLRGSAQLIYKDSLSALQSFIEAYKLKDRPRYFAEIFDLAMATGNGELAHQFLADFSLGNPNAELCAEWAAYFRSVNQLDTSKYILRNCLAHRPDEAMTYYELAAVHFIDRGDSALYYVDQYLDMQPDAVNGMLLKARILERQRYYTEARNLYVMAIQTDSTSTLAREGLENLERKVAYLRLLRRREEIQRQAESLNQLNSQEINQ